MTPVSSRRESGAAGPVPDRQPGHRLQADTQPGNVELAGAPIDQGLTGELDSGFYRNDQAFDIFIPDLDFDETRERRTHTQLISIT